MRKQMDAFFASPEFQEWVDQYKEGKSEDVL
jgi:hypothetical protein